MAVSKLENKNTNNSYLFLVILYKCLCILLHPRWLYLLYMGPLKECALTKHFLSHFDLICFDHIYYINSELKVKILPHFYYVALISFC